MLQIVQEHGFSGKKYFNGEEAGMVDIAFGSIVYWNVNENVLGVKLIEHHKFPSLHKWFQCFQELPVIKENVPDRDNMVASVKHRRETLEASAA
ncbi:hypothetical protein Dsin_027324 [Dipteronia sinensis]|uniref:Glutathione S-transferase C-terminal domain-containing protein n=1 Tax=Dipteronia sinensis TaxID=43782 RepID=A0AAE0DT76_9ROSI|nr:hypothetical protein Dsin_027324 [Dipteronia sinensis]